MERTINHRTKINALRDRGSLLLILITVVLVVSISIIKYRSDEVNYRNSDATWHTLLTIESYNETSVSEHLFLPIVSLGGEDNKNISWGETIPDKNGNFYYTSFSPAGYFAPWLFMKIFHLNVCEQSLYIFNTLLLVVSALLWMLFLLKVYENRKSKYWISFIGMIAYVLTPEILHGMGIVYWHQSLMQVTLLIQIIAFWNAKTTDSKYSKYIFYLFAFINPYIEWTGYVANVGFALAELISGGRKNWKKAFGRACIIGAITIGAFVIFCFHYLLRVDTVTFLSALKNRFMVRNIATPIAFTQLFKGYLESFLYIWVLLFILIVWFIALRKRIDFNHGLLLVVLLFPLLENVIMKQHAFQYTYDRMKLGFVLSFLICEIAAQVIEHYKESKKVALGITSVALIFGCLNLGSYMSNDAYTWVADYRHKNNKIASYVNRVYSDSVLGAENVSIRGYMNLLFNRGIYEYSNVNKLKEVTKERKKRYAVMLDIGKERRWEMFELDGACVYDTTSNTIRKITIANNEIIDIEVNEVDSLCY